MSFGGAAVPVLSCSESQDYLTQHLQAYLSYCAKLTAWGNSILEQKGFEVER